jgi:hypothetical protein
VPSRARLSMGRVRDQRPASPRVDCAGRPHRHAS